MEEAKSKLDSLEMKESFFEMALNSNPIDFAQNKNNYGILESKVREIKVRIQNSNQVSLY